MIDVLDGTFVRSGHANVRVVIEGSEEVFVGYPDVTHPLEQVLRFRVVQQVLDETPGGCDVHRTLADNEVMRRRRFETTRPPVLVPPDILRPDDRPPETGV